MRKSLLIFMCAVGFYSTAQVETTTTEQNVLTEISLIKSEQNIDISYSTTVDEAGNKLLNIHLLNTGDERKTVSWSVAGKFGANVSSKKDIELKPGKEVVQNNIMEIKGEYTSYPVSLTVK